MDIIAYIIWSWKEFDEECFGSYWFYNVHASICVGFCVLRLLINDCNKGISFFLLPQTLHSNVEILTCSPGELKGG